MKSYLFVHENIGEEKPIAIIFPKTIPHGSFTYIPGMDIVPSTATAYRLPPNTAILTPTVYRLPPTVF